jgi:hypothetical protein
MGYGVVEDNDKAAVPHGTDVVQRVGALGFVKENRLCQFSPVPGYK